MDAIENPQDLFNAYIDQRQKGMKALHEMLRLKSELADAKATIAEQREVIQKLTASTKENVI